MTSTHIILALIPVLFSIRRILHRRRRPLKLSKTDERVLVLGASSGIGRSIAQLYSERGARVCVVGRRQGNIAEVVDECGRLSPRDPKGHSDNEMKILGIPGDFADVDDMLRIRAALEAGGCPYI